ncbi:MAG: VCBS repeat-containing protein [Burkholderiales bacterium]|nr:VCBS repeat-containing protein [Burkholderiales bacterium]
MSVDPVDVVFDKDGKLIDITSLSYASLNYLLETRFSAFFDLQGTFRKVDDPASSLSVTSVTTEPGIFAANDPSTSLYLYKISHQTIGIDGDGVSENLGYIFSTAGNGSELTSENVFYVGDNVDLNDLVTKRPSFFVTDSNLLIVWDSSPTSDPSYLSAAKGSALASVDSLTTEKLLTLERDLSLDIDADGSSDGSIAYTKISVSNSVTLIKTSDGNFFTLASGETLPDSGRITLDHLRLKSVIAAVPTPAELRSYETSAKFDLNGDGVLGAAAEVTILTNDSFSIYKTTLGDVVYSAVPGIQQGDAIPDPISIGLSEVELSLVANSDQVVATIQNGKLYLAAKNQDSITGLTILRESVFELVGSSGIQRYASLGVPVEWKFNGILSDRLGFLGKEIFYNVDLNDDGVIGDAIVKQFASSSTSTIYRTASGVIYISSNNDLNFGDFLDKSALRLYLPDNAPDKIDACIRTAEGIFVFRSDVQANSQITHSKETFVSGASGLTSVDITALPAQDLIQAEILYGIDIDGNERLGGVISRVIFGAQGGESYPAITMQDTGLYQLDIGGDNDGPSPNVLIAARGASYETGDNQPFSDVYFLKNAQNSVNTFWNVPNYGLRRSATVIGQGIFDNNPINAIDIVIKDAPREGAPGLTNYYVVSFDSSGFTAKPNGTLLSPFALYNQELKIGTDLTADGWIGDTVSKIASSDTFGIYELNHSGSIVVTDDGTWVDEDPDTPDVQLSTNFLSLKNSSGSNWLPYGWKVTPAAGNLFNLSSSADRAVVKQVAFNPDDTLNVYLSRTMTSAKGSTNVIYNVAFNSAGVTKNPTGTVVPMAELFVTEMQKSLDINGDGFVGAPFTAVSLTQKLAVPNQLDTNVINQEIWSISAKVFKSGNSSGNGIANLSVEGSALTLFETRTSTKNSNFLSNGDPKGISAHQLPGGSQSFIYDFFVLNSKFSKKPYFVLICKDTQLTRKLLVLGPDNNYGFDKAPEFAPTFRTTIGADPRFVGSGDFNGDGHSDVVIINPSGIQIFRSDGRGKLANLQTINGSTLSTPFYGSAAYAAICDANGDRRSDLVVIANSNDSEIFTLLINKSGRLVQQEVVVLDTAIKYGLRSNYTGISSGDLNADKLDDIVLTGNSDNSVLVVFGTKQGYSTAGSFFSSLALTGINSPLQSHIVDINLDGRPDVVVLDRSASGTLQVDAFFGKGNNTFTDAQRIISTEDLRKPTEDRILTPTSMGEVSLSVGDFNNDGAPDLVISTKTENIIFYNCSKSVTSGSRVDITNPAQSASFTGLIDFGNLDSYLSSMELSKTVGFRGSINYTDGTPAPVASVPDISIVGVPQDFSMNLAFGSP